MKYILFLTMLLFIFTSFAMSNRSQEYHPSKGEQLVNQILAKTAKIIKEKYGIIPSGMGAAMPGGPIRELTLCFDTKHPYTKEQLTGMLVQSAQELIKQVNENCEIQEFLKEPPFTIRNIEVVIYNHDKDGKSLCDPEISVASVFQSILVYCTIDPEDNFKYKNRFKESYEEALKTLSSVNES